ncbi:AMP-dependent synthetase [Paracoccus subflavus]|uniref:AMP-dependent synthetase n=1 Tax=Paracoccus subflavus TaxID=2528244 RepID=A0A4Q9G2Q4_9RHOB|nr:AMP-binding protein [Paracoccus subflavus]TBN42008.1 AMP-dependent synthetase [Paracoccus subflavus]
MFILPHHLAAFAGRPCLLHRDRVVSYADLAASAQRFAERLPFPRGLIAIEMAPTPEAIAAHVGALGAGHAVMPLPQGEDEAARRLEQRFRPHATWRRIGGRWRLVFHENPAALHPDLAMVLQTSGSTGQGRGVRLSAGAVTANAEAIADYLRIGTRDRAALILPLHYSYGLSVLHSHLLRGASLWLAEHAILDPGFCRALTASGATSLAGVPHHFTLLDSIGFAENLPDGLDCMTVAGGAMKPAAVRHWGSVMGSRRGRFVVMYGQTEATARMAWLPPEQACRAPDAIGQAIPGGTLVLRDDTGQDLTRPEAEGELVYRGANVMMGYAETSGDLSRGPELDELATGDLARRGADGFFRIVGRRSRMSKIAGLRIGHDALERALEQDLGKAGQEIAVWGNDERIWVAAPDPSDRLVALTARLAGIRPQHVVAIGCPRLPRHPNGKIDYPALRNLAAEPRQGASLHDIFARSFAPRPVRPQDSFASLEGDSLRHVEISLLLDRHLGGLPDKWEQMSIAALEQPSMDNDRDRGRVSQIPMPILARAMAILAVVVAHQTLWPLYGGAAAMVVLLGMSVALHRREALIDGDRARFLRPSLRVLVPYGLMVAGYALAWGQVPWASVFLVGNLALTTPETHLMLPYLYWFVEAYVQMNLILLLLFGPRVARDRLNRAPFMVGLGLLGLGVLLRVTLPEFWPLPAGRSQFSVPWVFYLFALGWCIATATTARQRLVVLLAAGVILPGAAWLGGNWHGAWIKYLGLLGMAALLLYVPRVRAPRPLVRGAMHLARAAFPIYLLHRLVPEALMPVLGIGGETAVADALAIGGGIALGLLAGAAQARLWPVAAGLMARRRSWWPLSSGRSSA